MAYPKLYEGSRESDQPAKGTVPDPDWWSSNIGRDVKAFNDAKNTPLPTDEGQSKPQRPRDQFERAVQKKVALPLCVRVCVCARASACRLDVCLHLHPCV